MVFTKIDEGKEPGEKQFIAFKVSDDVVFAGVYMGNKTAVPFTANGTQGPLMIINEWMPIRLWM